MKINFNKGLQALLLLLVLSPVFSAQSFAGILAAEPNVMLSPGEIPQQATPSNTVAYTSIELSDPAVYAGEQFQLFIGLKNTGSQPEAHTVAVYRKDAAAPGGKVLMSSKGIILSAGQNTELAFTLAPQNLLVKGQPAPKSFIFIVGDQEIEVPYVK